jgi:hypothetical protein
MEHGAWSMGHRVDCRLWIADCEFGIESTVEVDQYSLYTRFTYLKLNLLMT